MLPSSHDQANNSSAAALSNAVTEGVTERVEVKTADMRQLPFPENYFDVVLSSWAIHNLEAETDRKKALDEIIRVLKPIGLVVLADIVYQVEYAKYFKLHGMTNIQLHNNAIQDVILKALTLIHYSLFVVGYFGEIGNLLKIYSAECRRSF
ncbi:methyltransferase domain-containing protein [Scytonema sp. UIC 10036]|uniref:class I SAM-dependent methyltransferase n=1 Tax=Scytonema sp. UIC 10036 TaxID=2304196 RepID=UPI0013846AA9|nr:methyltransferase domain-containing protein [Scytonema sp. UIC 10036]